MATWTIKDLSLQKSHALTIILEETDAGGQKYLYSVTKGPDATKAEIFAELKKMVLAARANRAKLAAIKAQINVNQIEAFLAQ